MAGLIGLCWSRSAPALTLPVSAFNWPTNDQSSVVDDLGYAVTQNPGPIEPRQGLHPHNFVTSLDDFPSLSGDEIIYTAPEDSFTGRMHLNKKPNDNIIVIVSNTSLINEQTTATTTAATTRLGDFVPAGYYRAPPPSYGLPMQYFRTHQDQSQFGWNDLSAFGGPSFFTGGPSVSGGSGVPLVPISLPNNQVAYVPLNLRMLRQLSAKMPIRESNQQSDNAQQNQLNDQYDDQEDDVPLSMTGLQSNVESVVDAQPNPLLSDPSAAGSAFNFNMLGQRRKSQPPKMAVRNPFRAFANNMNLRRVQFV
ncbi:uncharacterized protein Dwil_GK25524 [Drosophila willistoni]|uniref:DUF4794 domain-containing protein n=1 Tax=Drosophila willistoni TaxID=7260 RepID=B4NDW2_DROWI|nr:uncharacterized protein Dwil_GK25524 [Drosophila willistoni]